MTLINRKVPRAQLATLLTNTAAFQAVYKAERKSLGGQSPVAMLRSAGSYRNKILDTTRDQDFRLEIGVYVLRSGASAASEDEVEDQLDDLELTVAQLIDDNTVLVNYWEDMRYDQTGSTTLYVMIDGLQYRVEVIPVTMRIE